MIRLKVREFDKDYRAIKLQVEEFDKVSINIGEVTEGGGALPPYLGSYEVIPSLVTQELDTKNKSLYKNIEVKPIPSEGVSNPYGTTFIIGGI